ncbi:MULTISPECIES: bifunctional diguanylate cyclase/phosphodiesterase [unclassified Caballeronia]|uniref:sensor domain-containing protein n=1 Tax=unclassified Caballeronia TaxID=2646786 RepID=UPI0020280545|nr:MULTISPECIES: bifunctional diguanylate cyclase/phosphodiesterase [unclassified Caballeronia]
MGDQRDDSEHHTADSSADGDLRASIGDLRQHFYNHPFAMLVYEWSTLEILVANRAANAQYGYAYGELEGRSILCLRRPEDVPAFHSLKDRIQPTVGTSGTVGEWPQVRKDGSQLHASVHYQIVGDASHPLCLVSYLDVTELVTERQRALASRKMLEVILDSVPHSVYWKDTESVYLGCNSAFAREAGLNRAHEVRGLTDENLPWRLHAQEIRESDQRALAAVGHLAYAKRTNLYLSGEERWYSQLKTPLHNTDGMVVGVLAVHEDITEQRKAEAELRVRSRALDACLNAVLVTRPSAMGNLIEYANPAFERITGFSRDKWSGKDCKFLQREDTEQDGLRRIRQALDAERDVETVVRNYRANGEMFLNHLFISPVRDEDGVVTHHIAVINDVTEVTENRRRLEYQANFDALTDLPNRSHFVARLTDALEVARGLEREVLIGFLDIDDFKEANDSLGHSIGDALLKEAAGRLRAIFPLEGMVARYGGDEFAFFIEFDGNARFPDQLARQVSAAFSEPMQVDGHTVDLGCSIGLCVFPADGADVDTLVKRADAAMYHAKSETQIGISRYDRRIAERIERRMTLLKRMRRAIRNQEFSLAFQPQVDAADKRVLAVEVLLRWYDPVSGNHISPAEFIPLAEESSLIVELGEWVLRTACEHAKVIQQAGHDLRVAVNVSPCQFRHGDIVRKVNQVLKRHRLEPHQLELEITEGTLTMGRHASMIRTLARNGTSIAVDDFGTGYSNLSVLRTVRPQRIKLDMSLVRGIGTGPEAEALIHAVLSLSRAFGAETLAEGVETLQQRDFLLQYGCREMQGYLFAKPMNFETLLAALQNPETLFPGD